MRVAGDGNCFFYAVASAAQAGRVSDRLWPTSFDVGSRSGDGNAQEWWAAAGVAYRAASVDAKHIIAIVLPHRSQP